ncbi:DUF3108 domain-containing protein [bacterium]|nr:DUF3108 domain-containing protein [bacterium]MBU1989557.1 DUF3108 domain-containing protein [bacterium]
MDYVGEFSVFGKIANAKLLYDNDGKNYKITISGAGDGIVGKLTNHKSYTFTSIGRVENGILIPSKYINTEIGKDFNKTKTYIFDYANKQTIVHEYKKEKKEFSKFNIISMGFDKTYRDVETNKKDILDSLFKDDMVSVFFNKRHGLLSMHKGDVKLIYALGSEDTQEGIMVKKLDTKDNKSIFSVMVKKDYIQGGSDDATFTLDKNNILYETRVDGIMFFGDAKVTRVN